MPDVMKTVGRYEILREVGRGGMAMVYLARQTDLDRFVALKELAAFHASDESFAQRFLRESRVAGSLSHPNIVTVHDYFQHDGTPYIAMEFVERGSLRPYVGRVTLAQIGGVLEGLLAGLAHAEQHGIVHRDLKPENLMVTADGRVKIADFGIAKATTKMQTGAFLTATGTTVGTPTYMAPEQAMAQDIGPWTDLYSVGCMAFELFTGRVPFHDSDAPMAILLRHVNEPIPPVAEIDPSIDHGISEWIERLLVKDPEKRTRSANDAWDDFEEIIIGLLGPRWRREARLLERMATNVDTPKPLTPAPFDGTSAADAAGAPSEEFQSFAWGSAPSDTGPAVPGPYTPPPADAVPAPEAEMAPPPAVEEEALAADAPAEDSAFMTFGAPAPPPPTDALLPPGEATPPPAEVTPPAAEPEPAPSFETYEAPEPLRPPVEEPPTADALPPAVAPPPPVEPPRPVAPTPEPVAAVPAPPAEPEVAETVMPDVVPDEPPARTPPAEPGPRRNVFGFVLAGGIALAVVAGFLAGGSGGGTKSASSTPTVVAASPDVKAKVPAGWSRLGTVPAVPGLGLADPVAFAPGGKDGGDAVVLGSVHDAADNSTLLSTQLLGALGKVPAHQAMAIGDGLQAYRYRELQVPGFNRRVTLYTVPTSTGVATLACLSPPAGAAALRPTCDASANTMSLVSAKPFGIGPSQDYAKSVGGALGALDKAAKAGRAKLAAAKTPKAQAAAAATLAGAYDKAAASLDGLEVSPADAFANGQIVAALKATGGAYAKAAKAANKHDKGAYAKAAKAVTAAQKAVRQAVGRLENAGYHVGT
jgi:Protein kinase domain